jgi:hypothetical protein
MGNGRRRKAEKIHRHGEGSWVAFLVNSGGDYRTTCVGPVTFVGSAQKHSAFLVVPSELGTVALALWIGSDLIEAKNTHQHHSHKWGCQEKGLPAGLKGDTLHADPLV